MSNSKIISAWKGGLSRATANFKVVLFMYLGTFIAAFLAAYPLKNLFESVVGKSPMIGDLLSRGFDYTFLNDFNNNYGEAFGPIFNQSFVLVILFLILMVFFQGGIFSLFKNHPEKYSASTFWPNCAKYFFKMLRLSLFFLIIHGIILTIFMVIYWNITQGLSPSKLESETIIFSAFWTMLPIYILVASIFFMWQEYAKVFLVRSESKWVLPSIFSSLKFIGKKFIPAYGIFILNLLLFFLLLGLFRLINSFPPNTGLKILLSFFISQIYIILRLGLKLLNSGTADALFNNEVVSDK